MPEHKAYRAGASEHDPSEGYLEVQVQGRREKDLGVSGIYPVKQRALSSQKTVFTLLLSTWTVSSLFWTSACSAI